VDGAIKGSQTKRAYSAGVAGHSYRHTVGAVLVILRYDRFDVGTLDSSAKKRIRWLYCYKVFVQVLAQ
jgi:hypothetical protein